MQNVTITNLDNLKKFWQELPEGSRSDGLPSDLEAGNFDHASIELPDGEELTVTYTGPVAEGYLSPFERK